MPDKGSSEAPQTGGAGKKNVHRVDVGVKDCAIRSVVVYKDRAEVKRVVLVSLVAGENEIIIGDLAECVDKNSIRVEGEGNAIITDVIYSSQTSSSGDQTTESVSEGDSKEEHKRLVAEMKEEGKALRQLQFKDEVLKTEKKLLSQFANHVTRVQSVKDEGETLGQLVDQGMVGMVMEFFENYQSKMASLDGKILELNEEQTRVQERIKVLKANVEKINPDTKVVTKETVRSLHVSLEAREEGEVTLVVSYVVSNASWSSAYDVRVFTKDKAMKVQYYGLIKQATGEDWDDTRVSLSTAQPSSGGSAPPLPTRIIRFKRPPPQPYYFMADKRKNELMFKAEPLRSVARRGILASSALDDEDSESEGWGSEEGGEVMNRLAPPPPPGAASMPVPQAPPPPLAVDTAKVTSGLFNTAYDIPRTTSIPADSTEHKVTVALIDLTPEFHYTSVPRLSPHCFLQAKAKNTSAYTMLAGPANIFLDNNFIAKSEFSDVSPGEDFTTSLGADQSIRITCHPVAVVHGTKSGMLSKSTLLTYTHSFGVKNTRQDAVQLQISEQVPLSTDERIKVNVLEPEVRKVGVACPLSVPRGHTVLNDSHNLEWHITLQPETDMGLKLVYGVEFPQQDAVEGLPKL